MRIHGVYKDRHLFKDILPFRDHTFASQPRQKESQFFPIVVAANTANHAAWHAAQNLGPCSVTEWFQNLTFEKDVFWIFTTPVIT